MPELRYHHIGIPTDRSLPAEDYSQKYKLYASGYFQSPYGVEWMKFDPDCPLPELVKTVPHVAFVVDDIQAAIAGKQILIQPNSPTEGVTVAFIVDTARRSSFFSLIDLKPRYGRMTQSSRSHSDSKGRPNNALERTAARALRSGVAGSRRRLVGSTVGVGGGRSALGR
jgi:hypothetical protein